jgi:hypothetical protein
MIQYQRTTILLVLSMLACLATASGCKRKDQLIESCMRDSSLAVLKRVCQLVRRIETNTGETAPTTLSQLVTWLQKHDFGREPYIDYPNKTIKDAWGKEIVVMSNAGRFTGVGSLGSNEKWEKGAGDDLVVTLEAGESRNKRM